MTSFTYQEGKKALTDSGLLVEINLGRLAYAIRELRRWVYVHKDGVPVVEPGIVRRREYEIKLFLGDPSWRVGW